MCLRVCPSLCKCTSHKGLYKPAIREPFVLAARKALIDTISKGYYEATRGYLIYSPRAHPEVNEHTYSQGAKNKGLIFQMVEVSKLWCKTMANDSHVFN